MPLAWVVAPTATLAPVVENVATSAVTSVPNGTVAAMSAPVIVAVTSAVKLALSADRNANAVISFAGLAATVTATAKSLVEPSAAVAGETAGGGQAFAV